MKRLLTLLTAITFAITMVTSACAKPKTSKKDATTANETTPTTSSQKPTSAPITAKHDHDHGSHRISHEGAPEFVCPMQSHWHVVMSVPGKCALCGMQLKHSKTVAGYKQPKLSQVFSCPMASHWHVRSSVAGPCPLCKMKLVETRSIKGYQHKKK